MFLPRATVLSIVLALGCVPAFGAEENPPQRRLGIHGGDGVVWLYDHQPHEAASGGYQLNFALRLKEQKMFVGPRDLRFLNRATVRAVASVGDDLHVFYDASHKRYAVVGQRLRLFTEQTLIDGAVPLALAGDPRGGVLYAAVTCATAKATRARSTELADTAVPDSDEDSASTSQPAEPAEPVFDLECDHVLMAYRGDRWQPVVVLPTGVVTDDLRLVVGGDGAVHFINTESHRVWAEGAWRDGPDLTQPLAEVVDFVRDGERIGAVSRAGAKLAVSWLTDAGWEPGFEVDVGEHADVAAMLSGPSLLCARVVEDSVEVGGWSAAEGKESEAWHEVVALRTPTAINPQLRSFGAFGAMALLLGFVFWRRHDSVMLEIELPAAYRVASFWRRLLSFIIDFAIACVITWPFQWYRPFAEWLQQYTSLQSETAQPVIMSKGLIASWFVVCTAHVIYCVVCEAAFASTPGKIAVGCRVLGEGGGRPTFGQILIRNLLRYVELFPIFECLPPLVLILFTRNRQRLGDLIARTVIVEHIAPDRRRMGTGTSDHEGGTPPE